jgi:hypothetical protein
VFVLAPHRAGLIANEQNLFVGCRRGLEKRGEQCRGNKRNFCYGVSRILTRSHQVRRSIHRFGRFGIS